MSLSAVFIDFLTQSHMDTRKSAVEDSDATAIGSRTRRLRAHHALRRWMQTYPELFGSKAQVDCFIAIAMLTMRSDTIPSLNSLYRSLPYAENSVRSYVRSLAAGGWISFVRSPGGDRRSTGVRLEPPMLQVQEEYFRLLENIGAGIDDPSNPANATDDPENQAETRLGTRISA